MSGLSRTPGKRVWVYPHRGFESRILRQFTKIQRDVDGVTALKSSADIAAESASRRVISWLRSGNAF
jgi:hypothetical protein